MGLLESLAPVVASAVDIALTDLSIQREEGGQLDPASGRQAAGLTVTYVCRGRVVDFTNFERLNTRIEDMDRKVIITQPTLGIKPIIGDVVLDETGKQYLVKRVSEDPMHATWVLQAQG